MNSSNGKTINMKQQTLKSLSTAFALGAILLLGACHKKAAPPPPPPPPPAPAPTASISVSPDTIQQGQPATLSWQTSNATDVSIDGIGAVQPSGSQQVTPTDSTTYHLTAKGSRWNAGCDDTPDRHSSDRGCSSAAVTFGRGSLRPECEGCLFRIRQI